MTRFWWVRHGPTHQKVITGWRDVPADLSDQAQISRLDQYLPRDAVLISSDLIRAVTTADVLGSGRARLPHDRDLREFHFGDWEGEGFDAVAARDPDLSRAYWETPGDVAPPGGESWNAGAARVTAAVTRLIQTHPGRDIVVVAHFGAILTQLCRARGETPFQTLAQSVDPLSVTQVTMTDGGWRVQIVNHLP